MSIEPARFSTRSYKRNMPQKPYRIVFFGTSYFAVPILEQLRADTDFLIVEAITKPDRPVGRKHELAASPVKRVAESLGIKVWQPETLKDEVAFEHLSELRSDAYIVASYGKILPKRLLEIPSFGGINVHASILPKYRGASPISAAIAAGENETGVTIMKMDEKLDEGPTLATMRLSIENEDTTETLMLKLSELGAGLIGPTVKMYMEGLLQPEPQDHSKASYAMTLKREDGRIDWSRSAVEIERFVRAMRPWPEAHSIWIRKGLPIRLSIKTAAILHPTSKCDITGRPGTVCKLSDGTPGVNCGEGSLQLREVQLEGKKPIEAKSLLNGYPDFVGAEMK